jgi:xylulose-5-phosphate/fructose-6-phosphate phosphoketolase
MNVPTLTLRSRDGAAAGAIPVEQATLSSDELFKTDAYWRAANYLSVGQIYL